MIIAQMLLLWVGLVILFFATNDRLSIKWRVAVVIAATIHAAPLLITVWRYALLGGGE